MSIVLKAENISKMYRLGLVNSGTLQDDLKRIWYTWRGKEDPFLQIGEENKRDISGGDYVWALKDINFEIKHGEVIGIIGRNGAGKSTLLKLLSKVTRPSTGKILTKGRIASLLEVGTGFHPELTGRENIFLNGAILGMKKYEIKSKFDEIVNFSGCERYIDTPVKRYSSGMYVRLAFAVAAHLEPEILIVDEVLAVGDINFQQKCIGKMKDVAGEGRTVLFVSHNMDSIQKLCSKSILMEHGKIIYQDQTSQVINKYISSSYNEIKYDSEKFFSDINRRGEGKVLFKDVKIKNQNGELNKFEIIENEDVEFLFKLKFEDFVKSAICYICFKSPKYDEVVSSSKKFILDLKKIDSNNELCFSIKFSSIKLNPGRYNLYYWLGSNVTKGKYDIIDEGLPQLIVKASKKTVSVEEETPGFFKSKSEILYKKN